MSSRSLFGTTLLQIFIMVQPPSGGFITRSTHLIRASKSVFAPPYSTGKPADILPKVIASDAHKVVWNRRYDRRDSYRYQLKAALVEMNIEVESFNGNLLMEPWELKTKTGGPYKVFSPFWKNPIFILVRSHRSQPPASSRKCSSALNDSRTSAAAKLSWADGSRSLDSCHAAQEALTPSLHPLRPITMR